MPEETVLIVDDEPMVGTVLRSFLQLETTYRVLTYTSPLEALEAVSSEIVHVVIADFLMPQLDGIQFLNRCRETRPMATRILLTGYADKENAIRAINEAGLYYYLEKPWNNDQLRVIVRNGVERSTLFTQLDTRMSELERVNRDLAELRCSLIKTFL